MDVIKILEKSVSRELSRQEAIELLEIRNGSHEFYKLIETSNNMSRKEYNNKAYVFSQIGLNAQPCPMNCKFCSMAESNYTIGTEFRKDMSDIKDICETAKQLVESGTHDLFLMTTANYSVDEFIKIGTEVSKVLPKNVRLVANIGDFDLHIAKRLKDAGFTGVYHIRRLGEGKDTDIDPAQRIKTLDAIRDAGLELYYCVEPIGPEHTYDEILDEMYRAKDYNVDVMAVMRRTPVPGTPLEKNGGITSIELTKIAAVTRLVTRPKRSMNVHEVTPMSLLAGINQLYAEIGSNPRDNMENTENNRGWGVEKIVELFKDAEWEMSSL